MNISPTFEMLLSIPEQMMYSEVEVISCAFPCLAYKEAMVSTELVCHVPSKILDNEVNANTVFIKSKFTLANLVE